MNTTLAAESFFAAVTRCFGSMDDLKGAAVSALHRSPHHPLFLAAWGNDLRLFTAKQCKIPPETVLWQLTMPQANDGSLMQLHWDVMDWRACEAKWNDRLAHRPPYPVP